MKREDLLALMAAIIFAGGDSGIDGAIKSARTILASIERPTVSLEEEKTYLDSIKD